MNKLSKWTSTKPVWPPVDVQVNLKLSNGTIVTGCLVYGAGGNVGWLRDDGVYYAPDDHRLVAWSYISDDEPVDLEKCELHYESAYTDSGTLWSRTDRAGYDQDKERDYPARRVIVLP